MAKTPCACGARKKDAERPAVRPAERILWATDEGLVSNRELICRSCVYKEKGSASSCVKYAEKPESVLKEGKCPFYLRNPGNCC
jgi:hypothetical protein